MRILLTNDDGIDSPGIHALAVALRDMADVVIFAPVEERSGASHSLTLGRPVGYRELDPGAGTPGFVIDGTPVDCVRLAVDAFNDPFDLVVSGINSGANVGLNVHYSGTVAAALEAAFIGRMGLAVSIATRNPRNLETAAMLGAEMAGLMLDAGEEMVLNLNVPDLPENGLRGTLVTRLSTSEEETALAMNSNCSENLCELEDGKTVIDSRAVASGYVSVTPLALDLTAYGRLDLIKGWNWRPDGKKI